MRSKRFFNSDLLLSLCSSAHEI